MKKVIIYLIVLIVMFGVGFGVSDYVFSDRTPTQPINFSHKIHARDNEIPCMYCHIYAERSRVAGVPNVKRCMGCHVIIKRDSPEIQKLTTYWENEEPIPWVKVHKLPDHVYFPHKRHIRAEVRCQTCHGEVQWMDVVTREAPLKMGWCLDCHKQREVKNGRDCWTCHK
jgi:hypothetical protein